MNRQAATALRLLAPIAFGALALGCAADAQGTAPAEDVGSTDSAWTVDRSYFGVAPAHGGGGANIADLDCPGGAVLVGVHGQSGTVIDSVGIECADVHTDGSIGAPYWEPAWVGGNGGGAWPRIACPRGQANDQLFASAMGYGVSNGLITRIDIYCASVFHEGEPGTGWYHFGGTWNDPLQIDNCNGWWGGLNAVTGLRASYGTYVDSLWTQCRRLDP